MRTELKRGLIFTIGLLFLGNSVCYGSNLDDLEDEVEKEKSVSSVNNTQDIDNKTQQKDNDEQEKPSELMEILIENAEKLNCVAIVLHTPDDRTRFKQSLKNNFYQQFSAIFDNQLDRLINKTVNSIIKNKIDKDNKSLEEQQSDEYLKELKKILFDNFQQKSLVPLVQYYHPVSKEKDQKLNLTLVDGKKKMKVNGIEKIVVQSNTKDIILKEGDPLLFIIMLKRNILSSGDLSKKSLNSFNNFRFKVKNKITDEESNETKTEYNFVDSIKFSDLQNYDTFVEQMGPWFNALLPESIRNLIPKKEEKTEAKKESTNNEKEEDSKESSNNKDDKGKDELNQESTRTNNKDSKESSNNEKAEDTQESNNNNNEN